MVLKYLNFQLVLCLNFHFRPDKKPFQSFFIVWPRMFFFMFFAICNCTKLFDHLMPQEFFKNINTFFVCLKAVLWEWIPFPKWIPSAQMESTDGMKQP